VAEGEATSPAWVTPYESGLAAYRARDFSAAAGLFEQVLDTRPMDQPARMMLERCRQFLASPPGDDWEATNAMKTK
jgi:adenylate cyclase